MFANTKTALLARKEPGKPGKNHGKPAIWYIIAHE
jgi:hypothetical protein